MSVENQEKVVRLNGVPQSSVGAPCPMVVADELNVFVIFYLENKDPNWDGTYIRTINPKISQEPVGVLELNICHAYYHGSPNDESFSGHPLAEKGLEPYGAFEILNSTWLEKLEKMNSVHPNHDKSSFMKNKRHLIFTFHDSTFECICKDFKVKNAEGTVSAVAAKMISEL